MGNSQKLVFVMLIAILGLEFGSLTKASKIWQLAFGAENTGPVVTRPGGPPITSGPTFTTTPDTHPTTGIQGL